MSRTGEITWLRNTVCEKMSEYNLSWRQPMPSWLIDEIVSETGVTKAMIGKANRQVRKKRQISCSSGARHREKGEYYKIAQKGKFIRGCPPHNLSWCNRVIIEFAKMLASSQEDPTPLSYAPAEDRVIIIAGTPVALAVAPKDPNWCNRLLQDEMVVQFVANMNCYKMFMALGNAVDEDKCTLKDIDWHDLTPRRKVIIDCFPVTSETLLEYVGQKAARYHKKEILLLLMNSGLWNGDNKKYGFPVQFADTCHKLVKYYQNVRILAMKKNSNGFDLVRLGFERSES